MADQIIRPADLPNRASPVASEKIPVDNGVSVGGATIQSIVESGRPAASQAEAEAGVNPVKAMTPLTSRQGLVSQIGITIASKAQGDKADSAIQEIVEGTNTTVDNTDPQRPIISSSGNPSVGFKTDIVVVDGQTDWRVARNYKTVSDLLSDDGSGDMGMGYAGSGANVVVSPGDIVTAQGFRYEVAASAEPTADLETAGELKLNVLKFGAGTIPAVAFGAIPDAETDATAAIQKALNSGETIDFGGQDQGFAIGELLLEDGKEYHLIGSGAHLIRLDGVNAPMINNNDTTFVDKLTMSGLVIDGNHQGQTEFCDTFYAHFNYLDISKCVFDNGSGLVLGIMHVAEFASIKGCLFLNGKEHTGVRNEVTSYLQLRTAGSRDVSDNQHIIVSGNYFKGFIPSVAGHGVGGIIASANTGLTTAINSHKLIIDSNAFDTIGTDSVTDNRIAPINIYRNASQSIITRNRILRALHPAIDVQGSKSVIVSQNIIRDSDYSAITIAPRDEDKYCEDIIVSDNIINNTRFGVYARALPALKTKNITVSGNIMTNMADQGIQIRDVEGVVKVLGNTVDGTSGTASTSEAQAIGVMGTSAGGSARSHASVTISDNTVKGSGNGGIWAEGVDGQIVANGNIVEDTVRRSMCFRNNDGPLVIEGGSVDTSTSADAGSLLFVFNHSGDVMVSGSFHVSTAVRAVSFNTVTGSVVVNGAIIKGVVNDAINFENISEGALIDGCAFDAGATARAVTGTTLTKGTNIGLV